LQGNFEKLILDKKNIIFMIKRKIFLKKKIVQNSFEINFLITKVFKPFLFSTTILHLKEGIIK